MTQKKISLSQKIPYKGKLELKGKVAESEVSILEKELEELKNRIRRDVRLSFFNIYYHQRALQTIEKNIQLIKDFLSIAETRYSTGKGIQQDVLKAQVELSRFLDKQIEFRRRLSLEEDRLAQLLNRTQPVRLQLAEQELSLPALRFLSSEDLIQLSKKNRPKLFAIERNLEREKHLLALAYKDYKPDFNLGLAYSLREDVPKDPVIGEDFISFSVGFNLPVRTETKQDKRVLEEKSKIEFWKRKYDSLLNEIRYGIEVALDNYRSDSDRITLYLTGLIPQAEHSLLSARSGYIVDKVDFVTLIHNQITLFNYELEKDRLVSDVYQQLARIEFLTGVDLEKLIKGGEGQ